MRFTITEIEKQRSLDCGCLNNNVVLESLVIALTVVSGLAITGENLLVFGLITVPEYTIIAANNTSSYHGNSGEAIYLSENIRVINILNKIFHYTSLAIAALFFLEIFLKLCTLRKKCFTNPWQVFDFVVVVAAVTLELAFHFVVLHEKGLHSLTYIVMLRLWRIPLTCNIRAHVVMEYREHDLEMYRNGRLKAENRCSSLEDKLATKIDTIKRLEGMLHHLSGIKLVEMENNNHSAKKNEHLHLMTKDAGGIDISPSSIISESFSDSNFTNNYEKLPKNSPSNAVETWRIDTSDLIPETYASKDFSCVLTIKGTTRAGDKTLGDSAATDSMKETVQSCGTDFTDGSTQNSTVKSPHMLAETSFTMLGPAPRSSHSFVRIRKRHSSANEIIDYSSFSSPSKENLFYEASQKSSSCHSLDFEKDKLLVKDVYGIISSNDNSIIKETDKNMNSVCETTSKLVPLIVRERKRPRRFLSCPEYVFTQRMSITNDESKLIEDSHVSEHPAAYRNLGFDGNETGFLQVMAEFDGTKTYRNEDGIPMTSL